MSLGALLDALLTHRSNKGRKDGRNIVLSGKKKIQIKREPVCVPPLCWITHHSLHENKPLDRSFLFKKK